MTKFIYARPADGMVNTAAIVSTYRKKDADGRWGVYAWTIDGDEIEIHGSDEVLSDEIPNYNPDLEVWCAYLSDKDCDGVAFEIYPIVAWRADGAGGMAPVLYDDACVAEAVAEMIHDRRRNTWTIPLMGGFSSAEEMLNGVYKLAQAKQCEQAKDTSHVRGVD